jgi:hypothetical protein
MPLVSALFMSIMLLVAYTGSHQMDWGLRHVEGPRSFTQVRFYEPPARKSVVVDPYGQVQPTAAPTHPTKRDRSRMLYRSASPAPAPRLDVIRDDFKIAETGGTIARTESSLIVSATPVTSPVIPVVPTAVVAAPAAESALLDGDDEYVTEADLVLTNRIRRAVLSDDSLYVVSMHLSVSTADGVATLIGEVSTQREKNIIGTKAAAVVGPANVRNELSVLVG